MSDEITGSAGSGSVSVSANLWRGFESVGGRLTVSSFGLTFEPHRVNLDKRPLSIAVSRIGQVKKSATFGIIPNGMTVRTTDGEEYKFVLWNRGRIIQLIESLVSRH